MLVDLRVDGQNFLVDANLLNKVVQAADLREDEGVLEIGQEQRPIPVIGRCLNEERPTTRPSS